MKPSLLNRLDSFEQTIPTINDKQKEILQLLDKKPMTAWELSDLLNKPVYQVRPRLTELEKMGQIRGGGSKFQERTNRKETIYWLIRGGQLELI